MTLPFRRGGQRLHGGIHRGLVVERYGGASVGEVGQRAFLLDRECRGGARVVAAEINHLLALSSDAHAVHDGVVFAGGQAWDDAVPILRDEFAGDLHALAEVVAEVDLEADELAVGGVAVERHVGALGCDHHLLPVLRLRRWQGECQGQRECCQQAEYLHCKLPRSIDGEDSAVCSGDARQVGGGRGSWRHFPARGGGRRQSAFP